VLLGVAALSVTVLGLRAATGKLSRNISTCWNSPTVMFEPRPNDGPVLVTVRYRVPTENLKDFTEAMSAVRRSRLRTGGHSWRLYRGLEEPDIVLERFTVPSWSEFERQHTERWLESDHEAAAKAADYSVNRTLLREYFLAVRVRH
jgi:Transmembrane secretion effector